MLSTIIVVILSNSQTNEGTHFSLRFDSYTTRWMQYYVEIDSFSLITKATMIETYAPSDVSISPLLLTHFH